ncbi:MAG TPA: oligosaccharide flippase family protein [Candidatus Angelobacter sp.]|nr:oligosaccharide flippase family protein [Candidatus Angelobacter sp.]
MYKKIIKQTIVYGIGYIIPKCVNYLFLKLFTTKLAPIEFSLYSDMYSSSFLLINFLTFGLENSYLRFLYKNRGREKTIVFSNVMIVFSFVSVGVLLSGLIFIYPISFLGGYKGHEEYLLMFFMIIFLDILCVLPMTWLRANEMDVRYSFIRVFGVLIFFSVSMYMLSSVNHIVFLPIDLIKKHTDRTGYIFFSNFVASLASFIYFLPIIIKTNFKKINIPLIIKMLRYGTPIMIGALVFSINQNIDKLIIKRCISDEMNGSYTACYRIAAFISSYVMSFRICIEPFFLKKAETVDAKIIYSKMTYFFTLVGSVIYFFICSNVQQIAKLMINKKYHRTLSTVPLIMMADLFLGIYINFSISYKVIDKTIIGVYISLIGILVTILFNILVLFSKFGFLMSSLGILASYAAMLQVSYIWGLKNYPVNYPKWKMIFLLFLAYIAGSITCITNGIILNLLEQAVYLMIVYCFFFKKKH